MMIGDLKKQSRTKEKILELPYTEFWISDWMQLGFYYAEDERAGYNMQDEDGCNFIYLNLFYINRDIKREKYDICRMVVRWFIPLWWHEYRHVIGLTDDQIRAMDRGENTIRLE